MYLPLQTLVLLTTALALPQPTTSTPPNQPCNNSPALCPRPYNTVTHLGAHDSPFVRNASNGFSIAGDQFYPSTVQLDAGVRLLSAQVHKVTNNGKDDYRLCHTSCNLYDAGSLEDWLKGLNSWLDSHPRDILTVLLVSSDNLSPATLGAIFRSSAISSKSYFPPSPTHANSTQWPTLSTLIEKNTRLVSFVANIAPAADTPYLLDEFTHIFENNYDNSSPGEFSCAPDRPDQVQGDTAAALQSGRMPFMNHFLYDELTSSIEIPSVENVDNTNAPSGKTGNLGDAAAACTKAYNGMAPTFILTDFVNVGPAIATVDKLNNLTASEISGRKSLPSSVAGAKEDVKKGGETMQSATSSAGTAMQSATGKAGDMASHVEGAASTTMGDMMGNVAGMGESAVAASATNGAASGKELKGALAGIFGAIGRAV